MVKAKLKTTRDIILPDLTRIKDPVVRDALERLLKIIDEEHTNIYQDLESINDNSP